MKFTKEQLELARKAHSAEELLEAAGKSGVEMAAEDAKRYYAELHGTAEVSEEELSSVAGGCGDGYTDIYCKKCSWTTTWSGRYEDDKPYAGPCPCCGERLVWTGEYHND